LLIIFPWAFWAMSFLLLQLCGVDGWLWAFPQVPNETCKSQNKPRETTDKKLVEGKEHEQKT
jgi:hypothetical protein